MRRFVLAFFCCMALFVCVSCGKNSRDESSGYTFFFLSTEENRLIVQKKELSSTDPEEKIAEIIDGLSDTPEKLEYKAPFAIVKPLATRLSDGKLTIDMDAEYRKLPATTEVLIRAAIVRSFTGLSEVDSVLLTVQGEDLYDAAGNLIGWMNEDTFINSDGNEINTYEMTRVRLFFANESGDKLIAAYREKLYSANMPMERFVVEELIKGPSGQIRGLYPTVRSDTRILSISTKDGICYVNFDAAFLTAAGNVQTDIEIYSIVNSLTELNHINKVQILVNGETPEIFPAGIFERNLDCVTVLEQ